MRELTNQVLSSNIKKFIRGLEEYCSESGEKIVFYYGCEKLPGKAGEVIEALVPDECLNDECFMDRLVREDGLLVGRKKERRSAKLLILDPEFSAGEHGWLRLNIFSNKDPLESTTRRSNKASKTTRSNLFSKASHLNKRILSAIRKTLFFSSFYTPQFITISGVDGVGKTALLEEISSLLQIWGIPCHTFHYREINKPQKKKGISAPKPSQEVRVQSQPALSRLARRIIPDRLKPVLYKPYLVISGEKNKLRSFVREYAREYGYLSAITKELYNANISNKFIMIDRYWYDRIVQVETVAEFKHQSPFIARTLCFLAKAPRVAILLLDTPEEIYKRKNEIPLDEISLFQSKLKETIEKHARHPVIVQVAGRDVRMLSRDALRIILYELGGHLIDLLDEHRLRRTSGKPETYQAT